MLSTGVRRIVVATPAIGGRDGISEASRQWVAALERLAPTTPIEVWSLGDAERPECLTSPRTAFKTARGNRFTFSSFALRPHETDAGTLVISQHVHLVPVLLPLAWRGARLVPMLYGIEAWRPLRRLERAGLRRAWRIGGLSRETVTRFRRANPDLAALDVKICYTCAPPVVPRAERRTSGRFALIVGRMSAEERYKGHDALLDAWHDVRSRVPDAELIIAGDGDDRPRLEERARTLGLAGAVRFLGAVTSPELAALYDDCTYFVMPSTDEGFGIVFLEAMRAGKPCIAGRGAAEEIIDNGIQGLIVDPADRGALTEALVRLFVDDAGRAAMGTAARRREAERFGPGQFTERVSELLAPELVAVPC